MPRATITLPCPVCEDGTVDCTISGSAREGYMLDDVDADCDCEQTDAWRGEVFEAALVEAADRDRDRYEAEMDARRERHRDDGGEA